MKRQTALFVGLLCLSAATAEARRVRVPIIIAWGSGEEIIELGELPPTVRAEAAQNLGTQVKVGFHYERFHIWYGDVWTWNGKHVLFAGNKYWILKPREWQEMLGADPDKKYGTPFFYRVPLLLAIIATLALAYFVKKRSFKSEPEKLKALFENRKYRDALDYVVAQSTSENGPMLGVNPEAFQEAVQRLTDQGVKYSLAKANLGKMVIQVIAQHELRIQAMFAAAAELEEEGELAKSAAILEPLALMLPDADERRGLALAKLIEIHEKTKQSEPEAMEARSTEALEVPADGTVELVRHS